MKTCASCKFWSDQIAQARSEIEAMCLVADGVLSGQYTPEWFTCNKHEQGDPIDLPREAAA